MLIQHACLEPIFFHLILPLGGTDVIIGRESYDSSVLHKLTGCHVAYGTHALPHPFWQNLVFSFLLPFVIYLSGFDLLRFHKILVTDNLDILSLGTP